jgi:hypothetical protein
MLLFRLLLTPPVVAVIKMGFCTKEGDFYGDIVLLAFSWRGERGRRRDGIVLYEMSV